MAASTDTYKTIEFDYKKYLTNKHDIKNLLKRQPEKKLQKLILAFDEYPFSYVCDANPILDSDQFDDFENQMVFMNNVT